MSYAEEVQIMYVGILLLRRWSINPFCLNGGYNSWLPPRKGGMESGIGEISFQWRNPTNTTSVM